MLTFCATDLGIEGSAATMGNETEQMLLFPEEVECENASHTVDADTLFFVLNNDVLPDYEHNLTFSVSSYILDVYMLPCAHLFIL